MNCSTTCSIFKSLWDKFCAVTDFHHIYFKNILFHCDSEHHLVKMSFILPSLHHPSTLLQFLGTPLPIHGHRAPTLKNFTEAWRPAWESRVGGLCELFLCFPMRRTLLRPPENLQKYSQLWSAMLKHVSLEDAQVTKGTPETQREILHFPINTLPPAPNTGLTPLQKSILCHQPEVLLDL